MPISVAAPNKLVRPEITLYGESTPPEAVEVRRTYETVFRRLLAPIVGSETRRLITLPFAESRGRVACYETWPAAHLSPWQKPTQLFFCDIDGRRRDRSRALSVTADAQLTNRRPGLGFSLSDPTGTVPGGVEVPLGAERTMDLAIEAPVDPEIELFVLSPAQQGPGPSLEEYVRDYLADLEGDLAAEWEGEQIAELRSRFGRLYEPFLAGSGRIYAELEQTRITVGPGEPQRVKVSLLPESRGSMMLVFGARVRDSGAVTYSEMLPLVWDGSEPELTTGFGSEYRLVSEREPVKKKAKVPARKKVRKSGVVSW
jgi:hypothetical protein